MKQDKYTLCIDDTGYDYVYGENRNLKYHVGILVPDDNLPALNKVLKNAIDKFWVKFGEPPEEMHACSLHGRAICDIYKLRAFKNYLETLFEIVSDPKLDIKVFVSVGIWNGKPILKREADGKYKVVIEAKKVSKFLDYKNLSDLDRFLGSRNTRERSDMMSVFLFAKDYLERHRDGAQISTIFCDEGMRKDGNVVQVNNETKLKFVSSKDSLLVQFADNIAWSYNRGTVVVKDKSRQGIRKPNMVDRCVTNGIITILNNLHLCTEADELHTEKERAKDVFEDSVLFKSGEKNDEKIC